MDIGFVWDEIKYQAVIKKHNVRFYEVVAAFDDPLGYGSVDPNGIEDRWLWIGRTPSGRLLYIVYSDQEIPIYRIITAFDAEGSWINEYYAR